ncbi:g8153 [Coccomyxa elongata]
MVAGKLASAAIGLAIGSFIQRRTGSHNAKRILKGNYKLLDREERSIVCTLLSLGQGHVFSAWPPPGINDRQKKVLLHRAAAYLHTAGQDLEPARLQVLQAPKVIKRPKTIKAPNGDEREDHYYWLRDDDRENPEVLDHLRAETAYAKQVLADTEGLQEELYKELRGRIQEADQSVPLREDGYYYYTRTLDGQQYALHARRRIPDTAGPPSETDVMDESLPEEILLDENAEAEKHSFYMVGGFEVSPNQQLLAWAEDTVGGEKYTLHVKELATGKRLLKTPIPDTAGNVAWANDNKTLFYVTKDKLDRPYKIWRHTLGSEEEDALVYHETDDQFYISVGLTRSKKFLYISAGSAITSDMQLLDAGDPNGKWHVVLPRKSDVEYDMSHRGDHLFILLRDAERQNSELLVAPVADPTNTKVLLPHRKDVKLESVLACHNFLVVFHRTNGLQGATVYPLGGRAPTELSKGKDIAFEEAAYELGPGGQGDYDSDVLRLGYSSLSTPYSTIDYNMSTGARATKKVQPVLGGFDSANYRTERLWAVAPDGVRVPVSLVYHKRLAKLDGSDPLLLDGYGSYEMSNDPGFNRNKLSLIDRGFTYAIAHIRGGGDMGRQWYEDGKFLKKKNTFTDFIAVAEHLIAHKYTRPSNLCIEGRSAGGLTMGAVLNMRPDLFNAAILGVPFVDCLTTMLDDTIPLTVIEYDEWGNPQKPEFYDYMKSYSPVDNICRTAYPNILVTAGLHDPRVGYWEPAKFVAKLREHKTDDNMLIFKCDMGAGHFSQSGRFDRLKDTALEMAFLLKCQGLLKRPSAAAPSA